MIIRLTWIYFFWILSTDFTVAASKQAFLDSKASSYRNEQINYYEDKKPDRQLNNSLLLVSGLLATFGLNLLIEPEEIFGLTRTKKLNLPKGGILANFSKLINRLL